MKNFCNMNRKYFNIYFKTDMIASQNRFWAHGMEMNANKGNDTNHNAIQQIYIQQNDI